MPHQIKRHKKCAAIDRSTPKNVAPSFTWVRTAFTTRTASDGSFPPIDADLAAVRLSTWREMMIKERRNDKKKRDSPAAEMRSEKLQSSSLRVTATVVSGVAGIGFPFHGRRAEDRRQARV